MALSRGFYFYKNFRIFLRIFHIDYGSVVMQGKFLNNVDANGRIARRLMISAAFVIVRDERSILSQVEVYHDNDQYNRKHRHRR